jgi:hypothetical protein
MDTYITIKIEHPDHLSPAGIIEHVITPMISDINADIEQGWQVTIEERIGQ